MEAHRYLENIIYHHAMAMAIDIRVELFFKLFYAFTELFGQRFVSWLQTMCLQYPGIQPAYMATTHWYANLQDNEHVFVATPRLLIKILGLLQKMRLFAYSTSELVRLSMDNGLADNALFATILRVFHVQHAGRGTLLGSLTLVTQLLAPEIPVLHLLYRKRMHHITRRDAAVGFISTLDLHNDLPLEMLL